MNTQWTFDMQHSCVSFRVRHFLVSQVRGRFSSWRGTLRFDPHDLRSASVAVEIDTASVDTADPRRDADLRSEAFLDVARFPTMRFVGSRVERLGRTTFRVLGELTIRGVTQPVALTVEHGGTMRDPAGLERAGFSARAAIDRRAFGITFNQTLDHFCPAFGDEVVIELEIEATRPAASLATSAL
jgi:polyisoprenoid-binding protein YceI